VRVIDALGPRISPGSARLGIESTVGAPEHREMAVSKAEDAAVVSRKRVALSGATEVRLPKRSAACRPPCFAHSSLKPSSLSAATHTRG